MEPAFQEIRLDGGGQAANATLSPLEYQRLTIGEMLGKSAALSSIALFEMVRKVDDSIISAYDEARDIG